MIGVGFTAQPEERYLDLLAAVLREEPDYLELVPETTWRPARPRRACATLRPCARSR